MNSEHTPGPWTVTEHKAGSQYGTAKMYPYFVDGEKFRPAAILGDGAINRGVAEANARLISAAPDLLAALRRLTDYIAFDGVPEDAEDQYEQAERAIAKATGATP